jgi:hypothetical protein
MLKIVWPGAGTEAGDVQNVTDPREGPAPDIQPIAAPVFCTVIWHKASDLQFMDSGTILRRGLPFKTAEDFVGRR